MITLQNLEWRPNNPADIEPLYFHGTNYCSKEEGIHVDTNGTLDFLTYMNLFNAEKWKLYTSLEGLALKVQIQGSCELSVYSNKSKIFTQKLANSGETLIPIPPEALRGICSFKIHFPQGGLFQGGQWVTPVTPRYWNNVRIALIICTYHREEYLYSNLEHVLSSLPAEYGVFVIDNGSTLSKERFQTYTPKVRLISNPNTGGSGGFTRGIVEVMKDGQEWTHVHLSDDDIILEPEALKRSVILLKMLRPEFLGAFLSGAMLRMDRPTILHESSARWNGIRIKSWGAGLDLSNPRDVLANENHIHTANFAPWWYCILPLAKDMNNDLPFPFFIRADDIEYSLRRAKGIIQLNGIALWHESVELKHSNILTHYMFSRNTLILNALHNRKFGMVRQLLNISLRFFFPMLVHNYKASRLVINGLEDFLKGPVFILGCDHPALLSEKKNEEPEFRPWNTRGSKKYKEIDFHRKKYSHFFCYLLYPQLLFVDREHSRGELRVRSFTTFFSLIGEFGKTFLKYVKIYRKINSAYREIPLDQDLWETVNSKNVPLTAREQKDPEEN